MTDLFLNAYKGYSPKEAGALSYYAKALAHAGKLRMGNKNLPLTNIFGMGGLKSLTFDQKKDLLRSLKQDVLHSLSAPRSHKYNSLLKDLRSAVHNYYSPVANANITPPANIYDYYKRLQDMNLMTDLRGAWTPFGMGANQWVTRYNAPFLQGVKQPKIAPKTSPSSFTIS